MLQKNIFCKQTDMQGIEKSAHNLNNWLEKTLIENILEKFFGNEIIFSL